MGTADEPRVLGAGSAEPARRLAPAAGFLVAVAYVVALHASLVDGGRPTLSLALVALPWLVAATSSVLAWRGHPLVVRALAAATVVVAVVLLIAGPAGAALRLHVDTVAFVENVAFLAAMAALFGFSLLAGREPLVTRLARVVRRGDMPPTVVRYTRRATIAWALLFVALATVSTLLFATRPTRVWSTFANLSLWPIVAVSFVVEYVVRLRCLPDIRHARLVDGIRAFRQRGDVVAGDTGMERGSAP